MADHLAHQVRQQIRRNGVDQTQRQGPGQRVFAAPGDFFDVRRLLQNALRLAYDFFTQVREGHLIGTALKKLHRQLFFELLDSQRQGRLRHMAGFGRPAKVPLTRHGNDVLEFGQGHAAIVLAPVSQPLGLQILGFPAQPALLMPPRELGAGVKQHRRGLAGPGQQSLVSGQVSKTQQCRARLARP